MERLREEQKQLLWSNSVDTLQRVLVDRLERN